MIGHAAPVAVCACDPRHLEVGGFDRGCPVHDRPAGGVR